MSAANVGADREAERHKTLLDARSAALARRGFDARRDEAGRRSYLVCACGTECFGLPLAALASVLPDRPCTPVPGAPAFLRGIIAHAGAIVSVIDLGEALGAGRDAPAESGRARAGHLVRLRAQEPENAIALAVDRVLGLARIAPETIAAATGGEHGPGLGVEAVSGYCPADADALGGVRDGFFVIDLSRLLRRFLP